MVVLTKKLLLELQRDPQGTMVGWGEPEVARVIQLANHAYHTKGAPLMPDATYDLMKAKLQAMNASHPVLRHVGAAVAHSKARLPVYMGSLDKLRTEDASALDRFKRAFPGELVVSSKLDGVSALLIHRGSSSNSSGDGGDRLYTRGDGEVGQDISHLLPFLSLGGGSGSGSVSGSVVRGELIMSRAAFQQFARPGAANARNLVAGLVNAKTPDLDLVRHIDFVAYAVLSPAGLTPSSQLQRVHEWGLASVVHHQVLPPDRVTIQALSALLVEQRRASPYDIDGLVVQQNRYHAVAQGENPSHAFAFKDIHGQDRAETTVARVVWTASKDRVLFPVAEFDAVHVSGVTIQRASAHNAMYVQTHRLGPGARIVVVRSGDVIPYIAEVLSPAASGQAQMPGAEVEYAWTPGQKNIVVVGASPEVQLRLLQNFFEKVGVPGVSAGTLHKLVTAGYTTIPRILGLTTADLLKVPGFQAKSAAAFVEGVAKGVAGAGCTTLMEASNAFGRGFGQRRLQSIVQALGPEDYATPEKLTVARLCSIPGISTITAEQYLHGLDAYLAFREATGLGRACAAGAPPPTATPHTQQQQQQQQQKALVGWGVVFTGFRDKTLEADIIAAGGTVEASITARARVLLVRDHLPATLKTAKVAAARAKGLIIETAAAFRRRF